MSQITQAILKDKWLKLLSVALAIGVWLYVNDKTQGEKEDNFKVQVVLNRPPDRFILEQKWPHVTVTLRGPTSAVNQIRANTLKVAIDVAARLKDKLLTEPQGPQKAYVPIELADVQDLPPNVTVRGLHPSGLSVTLDRMDRKRLEVKQVLTGKIQDDLNMKVYLDPKQVIVRGPKSVLDQLDMIETLPVDIDQMGPGTWQPETPLNTTPKANAKPVGPAGCLSPNPSKVTVWIEITAKGDKAKKANVPVEVHGLPGLRYKVLNVDKTKPFTHIPEVEIQGPKKLVKDARVRAFVDLTDVTDPKETPEKTIEVQLSAPPKIEILTQPPKVTVQILAETTE